MEGVTVSMTAEEIDRFADHFHATVEKARTRRISDFDGPTAPIRWNKHTKMVHDHRNGRVYKQLTDDARAKRGLPVPWTPTIGEQEAFTPPVE